MITFSLDHIPFSTRGSFLTITSRNSSGSPRLLYKTCSGRIHYIHGLPFPAEEFFELSLVRDGSEVPYTWQVTPYQLQLNGEAGEKATLVFADPNTLLFRAENTGLKLVPCKAFPIQYSPQADRIGLVDWLARGIHMFRCDDHSTVTATVTQIITGIEKHWGEFPCTITFEPKAGNPGFTGEIRFARYETLWDKPIPEFELIAAMRAKEFNTWMAMLPDVAETYHVPAQMAWMLLWNCQVPQEGALSRQAIYMSKFWMNGIWSWDNLFNAIAVANADPQLAWDQLMIFFDYQEPNGMLPDMITDLEPIYGFTKPPLFGWAVRKLVNKLGVKRSLSYLIDIYKPLSRLTKWWYSYRDYDQDGLAHYIHGNDSGWDNSTIFDQGCPAEGADLAAYLVHQCECLAYIAQLTGRKKAALRWKAQADKQLSDLLAHSVREDHFISPLNGDHTAEPSQSLINYVPLILGKRLPKRLRNALIADLQPGGPYLTQFGLASEPPSSIKYMPDGYWRGPIWGVANFLIVDGLVSCGENELAHLVAERFCNLCLREPGFWENYDALTGKGLRCPGYSWTASTFLLLAEWLAGERRHK